MGKEKIKGLILDYGGVISHPPNSSNVNNILKIIKRDLAEFNEVYIREREDYDNGKISGEEYWGNVLKHFNYDVNLSTISTLIQEDVTSWTKINEDMLHFVKESKEKVQCLAMISNMTKDTLAYMKMNFRWLEQFDRLVFSFEIGLNKPDQRIYEICLDKMAISPEECLFVDDSPDNIYGAMKAGMNTIHFKTYNQFITEFNKKYYFEL